MRKKSSDVGLSEAGIDCLMSFICIPFPENYVTLFLMTEENPLCVHTDLTSIPPLRHT